VRHTTLRLCVDAKSCLCMWAAFGRPANCPQLLLPAPSYVLCVAPGAACMQELVRLPSFLDCFLLIHMCFVLLCAWCCVHAGAGAPAEFP
jgi:hypothetical protein